MLEKTTFKYIILIPFLMFLAVVTAQTAPDEDTSAITRCTAEGTNPIRETDIPNPVNVGTIDDRSCYANYKESTVYGKTWGVYNITFDSNDFDTSLQPRIERSLSRSSETGIGSYARFTGVFRILEVGDTSGTSQDGTYLAQAKGKHTGGGGSPDPAICLYLAKPVYGTGEDADKQVSFDIYAERILYRGGEGDGREIVFLKNVKKDDETNFELEVGFKEDPNDVSKKIHYCNAVIGGETFNWNIPEPERGTESGIRYGAYRVKGGRAQIRWANTTYQKVENVEVTNPGPIDDVYKLKNVATGQYLTDSGVSASAVIMSDSGEAQNNYWTFVESGSLFNIDSETFGILRAPGAGGPGGAYVVVSTTKEGPSSDGDKVWTIHYNESNDTYRFESGSSGRFMYQEINGNVTHISAMNTDDRSVWKAIAVEPLSVDENAILASDVRVFPNPARDSFTISLKTINHVTVNIYDVLGNIIFKSQFNGDTIQIRNKGQFKAGVYLIQLTDKNNNKYYKKLIVK
ncbi:endo-acting ulvan lyase [Formosa sp. 3Alg 14/1]|uniref:endo-acting ulvan lyase n=1 Tax=Formosa sp. 3Alg 14/1 TaxID=3382190 RepID=UPI0039BE8783